MDSAPAAEEAPLEPAPYGPLPGRFGRQVWARRPADEAEAKAIASPLRLRILRVTLHEPRTNKEIAEALGLNPASVLHHVRTLVDTGFLIEQPVRRGRAARGSGPTWPRARPGTSTWGEDRGVATPDLLLRTFLEEVKSVPPGALDSTRLGFRLRTEDRERVKAALPGPAPGDRPAAERPRRRAVEHLPRAAPGGLRRTVVP